MAETSPLSPQPEAVREPPEPDDAHCWVCGAVVKDRHCKIVCPRCGFMRDCSDP